MLIMNKKSDKNKVFILFSRNAKEHTDNTEIKKTSIFFINYSGQLYFYITEDR